MQGLLIQYAYNGDEQEWQNTIDAFITNINGDAGLDGKFSYVVTRERDGTRRAHLARWADQDTLTHLQSQPYFKAFAQQIQGFAGDTISTIPLEQMAVSQ